MAKNRGYGEGTIYKRKDGKWVGQVCVGRNPKTGKLKRKTLYGETRREVSEKLQKAINDINTGNYIETNTITLEQWLNVWLKGRKPYITDNTWNIYETMARCHINPSIGKIMLKDLKTRHIQEMLNEKLENGRMDGKGGLSPKSVKHIYQTLNTCLIQAVRERLIHHNPTEAAEILKPKSKELKIYNPVQIKTLLDAAKGSPYCTAILLALSTGLRRGEILGLKWVDIDFTKATLTVRQQLITTRDGIKFQQPKTEKSLRTMSLHSSIVDELIYHKDIQAARKAELGSKYQELGLVFSKADGKPLDPRHFTRTFKRIIEKAGLPSIRLHDTRHLFATLALESGVSLKTVSEVLGHSNIGTTADIYAGVTERMRREAAEKVGDVLAGIKRGD